jgi:hypothetical protein
MVSDRYHNVLYRDLKDPKLNNKPIITINIDTICDKNNKISKKLSLIIGSMMINIEQDCLIYLLKYLSGISKNNEFNSATLKMDDNKFNRVFIDGVSLCVNYKPNRIIDKTGTTDYYVNIVSTKDTRIKLETVNLRDIFGWTNVLNGIIDEWFISLNKSLPTAYLSSIMYIKPLLNIGSGISDLVFIPYENYKHDPSIIRGLGKGVSSCSSKVSSGVFEIILDMINYKNYIIMSRDEYNNYSYFNRESPIGIIKTT